MDWTVNDMGKYVWKSGDREEPLRLVSANDLNLVLNEWERVGDFNLLVRAVRAMIERVPTIDAVPVVRCKDCKFYNTIDWDGNVLCGCNLKSGMVDITPDGFCSYGERRDGDG